MKKINEQVKKIFESKIFTKILTIVGTLLVMIIIFSAGMITGFNKASFGRTWGEHYEKNFGIGDYDGPMGRINKMGMGLFPNSHGSIGKIIKISLPSIIVQDKDGTEKVILTTDDTAIEKIRDFITTADLHIDDFIVVVGSPNDSGQIEAKFIRIMPNPDVFNNKIDTTTHVQ